MITPVYVLNTLIVLGIVVCAVLTVTAKRTLSSIICLAACGAFVSLEFIMLQAPDVCDSGGGGRRRAHDHHLRRGAAQDRRKGGG